MAGWRDRYQTAWNNLTQTQRYAIIGAAIALVAAIVGLSVWYGSKPDMVPLFRNMEAKDAGEVTARLSEEKLSYEIQETRQGVTILVPAADVHQARINLAAEGLPHGTKGFEIFDDSKLGVTEFQNKVNYLQAMQGELTRTIEQISAVQKARVHIVFPEDSLYKKNEKPATASIMLMLRPNQQLSKKEVKGIVNFVSHSVQGLAPENITLVDENGNILNDPDDMEEDKSMGQQTMTQLDMTRKVQDNLQKNIQSLLDSSLGEGKAYVRVSVELDFDVRQTDRQIFTPVVDDAGIIRSQQEISENYTGTSTAAGGPAGVEANVPGYVAENNNANANYERKEATRNYEINEEKQKIVASPGSIKRLTVAVLVNDDVTEPQQESLLRSISSAAGINPERGDTISVEPLPFTTELEDRKAAAELAERERQARILYMELAAMLWVAALIGGYLLMRRRKDNQITAEIEAERRRQEEEARREAAERAALLEAGKVKEEEMTEEEQRQLSEKQQIMRLIDARPAEVAMLIKTWLAEED